MIQDKDRRDRPHLPGEVTVGPAAEGYPAVVDGKPVPELTVADTGGDEVTVVLDRRLAVDVPRDRSAEVCWIAANALAVGRGEPCHAPSAPEKGPS